MAQYGPKWTKNTKNGQNGQNSPKESGTNNMIFEYIQIYLGEFVDLSRMNLFEYSFVMYFSWQIYLDNNLSNIYGHK